MHQKRASGCYTKVASVSGSSASHQLLKSPPGTSQAGLGSPLHSESSARKVINLAGSDLHASRSAVLSCLLLFRTRDVVAWAVMGAVVAGGIGYARRVLSSKS